jgi:hypothetical protein
MAYIDVASHRACNHIDLLLQTLQVVAEPSPPQPLTAAAATPPICFAPPNTSASPGSPQWTAPAPPNSRSLLVAELNQLIDPAQPYWTRAEPIPTPAARTRP